MKVYETKYLLGKCKKEQTTAAKNCFQTLQDFDDAEDIVRSLQRWLCKSNRITPNPCLLSQASIGH